MGKKAEVKGPLVLAAWALIDWPSWPDTHAVAEVKSTQALDTWLGITKGHLDFGRITENFG